ncbi:MAG TPA: hypothetical protein DCL44_02205 [Elusimicrobia bacterium]|nr:hypothetical protein [Elusimicrobiota bacterium]
MSKKTSIIFFPTSRIPHLSKFKLLFTGYCLLINGAFAPRQALAGWLLWESPKEVTAPQNEKVIASAAELGDSTPEFAFSRSGGKKIPANFFFSVRLSSLRSFTAAGSWTECETELTKSAGQALKKFYSGQKPTNILPAKSWLLGKKPQDLSFCGTHGNNSEIYFWRLPFRDLSGKPFWAAAVYGAKALDTLEAMSKTSKTKTVKIKNARSKNEAFLISIR